MSFTSAWGCSPPLGHDLLPTNTPCPWALLLPGGSHREAPRHATAPLGTGLFLAAFSLATGRQEMLLQTVDENQNLQE